MEAVEKSPRPLTKVLRDRVNKLRPKLQPTAVEGVTLKVEPGTELDLSATAVKSLARAGRIIHRMKGQIAGANNRKDSKAKILTDFAKDHPNFSGFNSTADNLSVSVYPTSEVVYNHRKLEKVLGAAATTVIGEDLRVTLSIPLGHMTPGGKPLTSKMAKKSLRETVRGLGFSKKAARTILQFEIIPRIDELKLTELSESGQIDLPEDVATVTETYHVRTDLIDKSQNQQPTAVNPSLSTNS